MSAADPSLAGVRTALSWQRSVVLVGAAAGAIAKDAIGDGRPLLGVAVGGGLLTVTAGLYLWRGRLGEAAVSKPHARRQALQALTAVAVLTGICALAIAILIGA